MRYVRAFAIAAFVALLVFPSLAKADEFLYTVTNSNEGSTATFLESSLASSGDATSFLSNTGATMLEFVWQSPTPGGPNTCSSSLFPGDGVPDLTPGFGCAMTEVEIPGGGGLRTVSGAFFTLPEFASPGTYQAESLTVKITDVSGVPEPSSLVLLGGGLIGLAGIKRRRSGC